MHRRGMGQVAHARRRHLALAGLDHGDVCARNVLVFEYSHDPDPMS